ncbi:MAG TPA: type II secretion system protein N [Nevskiaceae bacterium]|nr:type II secretion system protein N [Nevskiaceae bacterium]
MTRRWLIALAIAGFLYGMLMRAPAATLAWYGLVKSGGGTELYGLQGTLGEGTLTGLQFGGRRVTMDLRWTLKPLWLLLGQARFHVTGSGSDTATSGDVALAPLHTVRLRSFQASGGLKPVLAAAGQAFLPVDGQVSVDADQVTFNKGVLQNLAGTVHIQQLMWTLARDPVALGDFQAQVSSDKADSVAKIESTGGPMELSGDGRLGADQTWQVDLKFRLKSDATPMLRNLVAGAGAPDAQGWYHLKQSGKLKS